MRDDRRRKAVDNKARLHRFDGHSGGFYAVGSARFPTNLSKNAWFRWEAGTHGLVPWPCSSARIYRGGPHGSTRKCRDSFIEAQVGVESLHFLAAHYEGFAIVLGIFLIFLAGFTYDVMMLSPLGRNEKAFAVVAYLFLVGMAFGLTRVLSARAAYIHIGAMMGTIMAANVWMHILPAQKKMIAAIKEGRKPDDALSTKAKLRSKQNTFMAVPVVFLMISNHFPGVTYGERNNWLILAIYFGWLDCANLLGA